MTDVFRESSGNRRGFPSLHRLRQIGLWLILGFTIGWLNMAIFGGVGAKPSLYLDRFDPDIYPAIDIGHTPPVLVRSDETVRLEFRFACGYQLPNLQACRPDATLFATWAPGDRFAPIPLVEENHDSLRVLTAALPAAHRDRQTLRYYLDVRESQAGVPVRYPSVGTIEPVVVPVYTRIQLPAGQQLPTELVLRLPWGNGSDNAGLAAGSEQVTVGPDSLDVSPNGTIALLDHVNTRVMIVNTHTHTSRSYAVPVKGVGDVAIDAAGRVAVLDMVGVPAAGSKARIPQIYQFDPNGKMTVTGSVFARRPGGLNSDLTVLDRADGRMVRPLTANGQMQNRDTQRLSRSRPDLQVQWLDDYRTRLADLQHGVAVEIMSDTPLGAVAHFGRVGQAYVSVFEWMQHLRVV
jgi:hypothetical protein